MKKIIICATVSLLAVLPSVALEEIHVREAILRAEAASRAFDPWDEVQQKKISPFLNAAVVTMTMRHRLVPEDLGSGLFKSISRELRSQLQRDLVRDEERAVLYALHFYLGNPYCDGLWTKERYEERYSDYIADERSYAAAYEFTAKEIYIAVVEIASETQGYEKWLQDVIDDVTRRHRRHRRSR